METHADARDRSGAGARGLLRSLWLLVAGAALLAIAPRAGAVDELYVISERARIEGGGTWYSRDEFGPVNESGNRATLFMSAGTQQFDVLQPDVPTPITNWSGSVTAYTGVGTGTERLVLPDRLFIDLTEDFTVPRTFVGHFEFDIEWVVDVTWDRPDESQQSVTLDWVEQAFVLDLGGYGEVLLEMDARQFVCPTSCGGGLGPQYSFTWTVPEPGTAALVGAGLAGLARSRRRRSPSMGA